MSRFPSLERILFLDIESVPLYDSLSDVPEKLHAYWIDRYNSRRSQKAPDQTPEDYFLDQSAIHALYSRVACIGLGYFYGDEKNGYAWREHVISNLDEKELLKEFVSFWNKSCNYFSRLQKNENYEYYRTDSPLYSVCGHNIQNFDLPFLGRRMLLNRIENLPEFWRESQNAQPWQLKAPSVIDTMLLWNFTSRENSYISLEMLAYALGLDFEKSLDHVAIREAFAAWQKTKDSKLFDRVREYCLKDVQITAAVYLTLQGKRDLISKLSL